MLKQVTLYYGSARIQLGFQTILLHYFFHTNTCLHQNLFRRKGLICHLLNDIKYIISKYCTYFNLVCDFGSNELKQKFSH